MTPTDPQRPAPEPRGCLPTLVVFLIMVGILGTGVAAENAVAARPPVPIEVGHGVFVTPPPDWEFGGRSEDGNTILLSKGSGSVAVHALEGTDAVGALNTLRDEWLASGNVTTSDIGEVPSVRPTQAAYGFAYSGTFPDLGTPVEGEVTGFAGSSVVVLFDGWAGFGDYQGVSEEIDSIIRAAVIP